MSKLEVHYVCTELNLEEQTLLGWIDARLIVPADLSGPYFDQEDLARLRLMADLKKMCEASDSSIEVILHLVDQIHHLTAELKAIKSK